MASIPEDLIAYLVADAGISEVAGTDIHEGPPPELPADLVAITHYAGDDTEDRVMSAALTAPELEVALVQLYVRNAVMSTAKSKADAYHALLDNYNGTLSGRKYYNIESLNSTPYSIGQNKRLAFQYECNYRVEHAR